MWPVYRWEERERDVLSVYVWLCVCKKEAGKGEGVEDLQVQ